MIDLADIAKSLIADLLDDASLDLAALREGVYERSFDAAESACIYTHACADIIAHYESDPRADTEGADDGATYQPSRHREAMQHYAHFIARSIIEAEAFALVDELDEAQEHLVDALAPLVDALAPLVDALAPLVDALAPLVDADESDYRLSRDCPHGWAAHDREDGPELSDRHGACYWVSHQLDGCNAVAVPAAGVWLSYTWEPARAAA